MRVGLRWLEQSTSLLVKPFSATPSVPGSLSIQELLCLEEKRMNNELQHRLSITNPNWTLLIFVIKDLESVSRELTSYLY